MIRWFTTIVHRQNIFSFVHEPQAKLQQRPLLARKLTKYIAPEVAKYIDNIPPSL